MTEHDDQFVNRIKQTLDAQSEQLDAGVRSKLTRARYTALDAAEGSASRSKSWMPLAATAGAMALALVLGIAVSLKDMTGETPGLQDVDLLVAEEPLDFYAEEDLEFYAWVSEQEANTDAG